jgi:ribosomal protein S18 acetylase RimI-like enzyme
MTAHSRDLQLRRARRGDLPAIVALLPDDMLGAAREAPGDAGYERAFDAIEADANQYLLVGERGSDVVAFLQIAFIPGLGRRGAWRAQIESVRVAASLRGGGIGTELVRHAIALARQRGCRFVQLTTDKRRQEAHRFYARLGFDASHDGMKLALE